MNRLTSEQSGPAEPAVRLEGASRRFGATLALDSIDLELSAGRIHALVGQNGAGKSTCLGLIAGRISPTSGRVIVHGAEYPAAVSPHFAQSAGVMAIYQELTIFPALTALENVFTGRLDARAGWVRRRDLKRQYRELCDRFGVSIDGSAVAGTLSLADQQMLEIMRAVARDARVLLLDEPTAALAPQERESLFRVMRELRSEGVCMIVVSHYLDEVLAISDTITVFRDGRVAAATRPAGEWNEETLIAAMLGGELSSVEESLEAARDNHPGTQGEPVLTVSGLTVGALEGVDLEVRAGEIVGIGGLVGSGRSTLLRALAGAQPALRGEIRLKDGRRSAAPRNPREAWRQGIAYIPEDRKTAGVLSALSGRENIVLAKLRKLSRAGFISSRRIDEVSSRLADDYGLPQPMLDKAAGTLSGGNQQKLLLARAAISQPTVLLADEATRGIDVGAKGQILIALRRLADQGLGVVFVSSDLEEVVTVSDRIYVFRNGRVADEFPVDAGTTQDDILTPAFGIRKAAS